MSAADQDVIVVVDLETTSVSVAVGEQGPAGPQGEPGEAGAAGADGVGVPSGGTSGQVLAKNSNANFDTAWTTISTGNPFDQDLNTTDSPSFDALTVSRSVDATTGVTSENQSSGSSASAVFQAVNDATEAAEFGITSTTSAIGGPIGPSTAFLRTNKELQIVTDDQKLRITTRDSTDTVSDIEISKGGSFNTGNKGGHLLGQSSMLVGSSFFSRFIDANTVVLTTPFQLEFWDVTDPALITQITYNGLGAVGNPVNLHISHDKVTGRRLAFVVGADNLVINDFTNLRNGAIAGQIGSYNFSGLNPRDFCVKGNYLFAVGLTDWVALNISDPTTPTFVSTGNITDSQGRSITATDTHIFIGTDAPGLYIWNVSNVASPTPVTHSYTPAGSVSRMLMKGDMLIMNSYGLALVDVRDPANPTNYFYSGINTGTFNIKLHGDYLIAGDYSTANTVSFYDISSPTVPREITELETTTPVDYPSDFDVWGSKLLVNCSGSGDQAFVLMDLTGANFAWGSIDNLTARSIVAHRFFGDGSALTKLLPGVLDAENRTLIKSDGGIAFDWSGSNVSFQGNNLQDLGTIYGTNIEYSGYLIGGDQSGFSSEQLYIGNLGPTSETTACLSSAATDVYLNLKASASGSGDGSTWITSFINGSTVGRFGFDGGDSAKFKVKDASFADLFSIDATGVVGFNGQLYDDFNDVMVFDNGLMRVSTLDAAGGTVIVGNSDPGAPIWLNYDGSASFATGGVYIDTYGGVSAVSLGSWNMNTNLASNYGAYNIGQNGGRLAVQGDFGTHDVAYIDDFSSGSFEFISAGAALASTGIWTNGNLIHGDTWPATGGATLRLQYDGAHFDNGPVGFGTGAVPTAAQVEISSGFSTALLLTNGDLDAGGHQIKNVDAVETNELHPNSGSEIISTAHLNLAQSELREAVVQNLGSAPSGPVSGQIYFDTNTNKLRCYDGSTWQNCW